ncbi:hypothetical protein ThrDRAFT_02520 [Frankia casuarinae]|jgi:hypothetical protein|uniref:hypothetical protein n=1 Tax=Frankia casuarinae (strain DSM 45818 / CECT 9043 / HFP020203 / CcI3) TaxID=106370 RepID=UPI000053BE06|nr:hypothetical protein [Frankia casuarinae]EYT91875.1 hypothetical protein ThrDRAFT_02520 [Frankia casuarinae]
MDAHASKAPRLSDPQRRALTFAHAGVLYYRADSFGHGYYGERDSGPVRVAGNTFEAIERRGWVVREPAGDLSLHGGTVTILAYVLTEAGRTVLGVEPGEALDRAMAPDDDGPVTVDVADVRVGMAMPLGWVDYVSRLDEGGAIVYYRPFDRSALTCRAWPPGQRLPLVPCPHLPTIFDQSRCAKCGQGLGGVAA